LLMLSARESVVSVVSMGSFQPVTNLLIHGREPRVTVRDEKSVGEN
jgi:hypothetical protein